MFVYSFQCGCGRRVAKRVLPVRYGQQMRSNCQNSSSYFILCLLQIQLVSFSSNLGFSLSMHIHTKKQTFYQQGNHVCILNTQINNKLSLRIVLCNIFMNLFSDFHICSPRIHTIFIYLTIFNEDMVLMITTSTMGLLMVHAAKAQQGVGVHEQPPSCVWPPTWLLHILKYWESNGMQCKPTLIQKKLTVPLDLSSCSDCRILYGSRSLGLFNSCSPLVL